MKKLNKINHKTNSKFCKQANIWTSIFILSMVVIASFQWFTTIAKNKNNNNLQQLDSVNQDLLIDTMKSDIAKNKIWNVQFSENTKNFWKSDSETKEAFLNKIKDSAQQNSEIDEKILDSSLNIKVDWKKKFLVWETKSIKVDIPKVKNSESIIINYLGNSQTLDEKLWIISFYQYKNSFDLEENQNLVDSAKKTIVKKASFDSDLDNFSELSKTWKEMVQNKKSWNLKWNVQTFKEAFENLWWVWSFVLLDLWEVKKINKVTVWNIENNNSNPIKKIGLTFSDWTTTSFNLTRKWIVEFKFPEVWTKEIKIKVLSTY